MTFASSICERNSAVFLGLFFFYLLPSRSREVGKQQILFFYLLPGTAAAAVAFITAAAAAAAARKILKVFQKRKVFQRFTSSLHHHSPPRHTKLYPTKRFLIEEPLNSSMDVFKLLEIRQSTVWCVNLYGYELLGRAVALRLS